MQTPEFPRPAVARNPGDGWGATTVRGPRETVEKETAGHETTGSKKYNPPPPERR